MPIQFSYSERSLWRKERVIIELDGQRGHDTPTQIARDHERDLRLRAVGLPLCATPGGRSSVVVR